jgi:hypothetical protein
MCTPAVVPSASNVKTSRPVEVAFKTLCTLAKNTMFITSRNATQCSNCVAISRSRLELSTLGHPYQTQTRPMIGARISQ